MPFYFIYERCILSIKASETRLTGLGMDQVTFSIYCCTWIMGVCLPVIVFWLYRTLQKMR